MIWFTKLFRRSNKPHDDAAHSRTSTDNLGSVEPTTWPAMTEDQLLRFNKHIQIVKAFDKSLEPSVAKALLETPVTNEPKAKESLPHAIAWDIQDHCEESAYRVAHCWQSDVTAQFKRWQESVSKSSTGGIDGSLITETAFTLLKIKLLTRELASRICFNMLLKESPSTALRSVVYGSLGLLSFMKCFTVEGAEKDTAREDAKWNLDLAISFSGPSDPTLELWKGIRGKC